MQLPVALGSARKFNAFAFEGGVPELYRNLVGESIECISVKQIDRIGIRLLLYTHVDRATEAINQPSDAEILEAPLPGTL